MRSPFRFSMNAFTMRRSGAALVLATVLGFAGAATAAPTLVFKVPATGLTVLGAPPVGGPRSETPSDSAFKAASARLVNLQASGALTVGSTVELVADVVDAEGAKAPDGVEVRWAADVGFLSAPTTYTAGGKARVTLEAPTLAQTIRVTGTTPSSAASTSLEVAARPDYGRATVLYVFAAPSTISAGGQTTLRALVADPHGNGVSDGATVQWESTSGTLSAATSRTAGYGEATSILTAGGSPGIAVVTAKGSASDPGKSINVTVNRRPGVYFAPPLPTTAEGDNAAGSTFNVNVFASNTASVPMPRADFGWDGQGPMPDISSGCAAMIPAYSNCMATYKFSTAQRGTYSGTLQLKFDGQVLDAAPLTYTVYTNISLTSPQTDGLMTLLFQAPSRTSGDPDVFTFNSTLTNPASSHEAVSVAGVRVSGITNGTSVGLGTCGAALEPGQSCAIQVAFVRPSSFVTATNFSVFVAKRSPAGRVAEQLFMLRVSPTN
ncbi:hypothetical protein H6P1_00507 (plasmid) [Variovorax sp. PBL-H6]|nr:Ig-like domain-containing protein [Variovorax sp. SRS16]VTU42949.1 hypothetical protein SRS16P1_00399 [Variovorax sp. SRS16]VTU42980.1 hypothetical protein E5P1_00397 [Variovorax sp. PBL-E5]VTU43562.1 hypothetical protein H6P1_00507 [Variovorax sp. PBL-H6]